MATPSKLLSGDYDNDYSSFLKDRYNAMEPMFTELKIASSRLNDGIYDNIWKQ
tara:strand:+ start:536 stop:694 length:159 start_codon:yes stop_codon:yes gene_type:complete